jgi:hypothetical protein
MEVNIINPPLGGKGGKKTERNKYITYGKDDSIFTLQLPGTKEHLQRESKRRI